MIAGNFEDKYNSKNPLSKILVKNFLFTFKKLLNHAGSPERVVELGAGEGYLMKIVSDYFPDSSIWGSDISKKIIKVASANLNGLKINLSVEDIGKMSYKSGFFDLVICCEVLEHVKNPEAALKEISRICRGKVLLSVPGEPLWRILNMTRGKYLKEFGNTPGHLNHFTPEKFLNLVRKSGFKILSKRYPLPWQMILAEKF